MDNGSKNNNRIFLKLLKDVFHSKRSNESPPMKCTYCNGKDSIAFSDTDKFDILNKYLYFISNISITTKSLPDFFFKLDDTVNDILIEEYEVIDIISVLLVNKAI